MNIAKFHCPNCNQQMDSTTDVAVQDIECPTCNFRFRPAVERIVQENDPATAVLKALRESTGSPEKIAPEILTQKRIAKHLDFVRSNTCYALLRGVIDVCFWLAVVGVAITWVLLAISADDAQYGILSFLASALAITLLFAGRQSALLLVDMADTLIDIADTLLHERSKSK